MSLAIDQIALEPRVKRWTKREYNELVQLGVFRSQRVYLFRGEIIEMSPQLRPHAHAVLQLTHALFQLFGANGNEKIRIQLPFDAPGDTMPEPDALVCTISQNNRDPHPNSALLAVEVSDSSLGADREKAFEYAAAQIPEYWIIDTNWRRVEVYRAPVADPTASHGFRYPPPTVVNADGAIEPLSKLGSPISVRQFFLS
jgi:Uma2 family endonuclease